MEIAITAQESRFLSATNEVEHLIGGHTNDPALQGGRTLAKSAFIALVSSAVDASSSGMKFFKYFSGNSYMTQPFYLMFFTQDGVENIFAVIEDSTTWSKHYIVVINPVNGDTVGQKVLSGTNIVTHYEVRPGYSETHIYMPLYGGQTRWYGYLPMTISDFYLSTSQ